MLLWALFPSYSFKTFPLLVPWQKSSLDVISLFSSFFMCSCHISLFPCFLFVPLNGKYSHLFPPLFVFYFFPGVYLSSQLLIITLWRKVINSDPIPFVKRFPPGFDPICPTDCKLIPLGGVISHIRYVFYIIGLRWVLPCRGTDHFQNDPTAPCHFPWECQSLPLAVLLVDQQYAWSFGFPPIMLGLG